MKKMIVTAAAVLCLAPAPFAQNVFRGAGFTVHGNYEHPVKKETLENARSLGDIISDYPKNWITDYISVEISAKSRDKTLKSMGTNAVLNAEQKGILHAAGPGDDITIDVRYTSPDVITRNAVNGHMRISYTVVPETEAAFVGGNPSLSRYLEEKGIEKILEKMPENLRISVRFTVNERGEITDVRLSGPSGHPKVDELLLDAVRNMPGWKPAENTKGEKVKQEFEFTAGRPAEGC